MRRRFGLPLICFVSCCAATWASDDSATFQRGPARAGDVSRQTIDCDLDLEMSIQQGGQVVQSQHQGLLRQQVRELKILNADDRAATQADVRYDQSSVAVRSEAATAQMTSQPVTGKTYRVTRQAEQLSITYPNGQTPPQNELEIVAANMETFGLPNPIAQFFHGKQIQVGQRVQLPTKLARELLGFSDTVGNISDFQLQLLRIRPLENESQAAEFAITLTADHPDATAVSMQLTGQLVMETNTCRTMAVQLEGPIRASETHGPAGGQFQVCCEGKIRMAVEAQYETQRR